MDARLILSNNENETNRRMIKHGHLKQLLHFQETNWVSWTHGLHLRVLNTYTFNM